jgi:uncharacterized membrane protein YedE/YeeE
MYRIFILGLVFGITLTMGEVISWFRIQEMFRFESFHMYGVIGGAVVLGALFNLTAKWAGWKATNGEDLDIYRYEFVWKRYLLGGTLFGMGWAVTGACPGPLFITLGAGYLPVLLAIIGALIGTLLYGVLMRHLPH